MERLSGEGLSAFIVWLPMMPGDSAQSAEVAARSIQAQRVYHFWDPEREVGEATSKVLGLRSTAWDVYLLYAKDTKWERNLPPWPAFWMHQLPAGSGASYELLLNTSRISRVVLTLFGKHSQDEEADLSFTLHYSGLMAVATQQCGDDIRDE